MIRFVASKRQLLIAQHLLTGHCSDLLTVKVSIISVKEVMIFLRYDQDASAHFERDKKARQAM